MTSPAHAARHGGSGMKTREPLGEGSAPLAGAWRGRARGSGLHGGVGGKRALAPAFSPHKPGNCWEHFPGLGSLLRAGTPICRTGRGVTSRRPRPPPMRMAAVRCPGTAPWTPALAASPALHALQSAAPAASASGLHAAAPQRRRRWGTLHDLPRPKRPCVWDLHRSRCRGTPAPAGGPWWGFSSPLPWCPRGVPLSSRVELVHRNRIWW